jgi:hypothetical protein
MEREAIERAKEAEGSLYWVQEGQKEALLDEGVQADETA